MKGVTSGVLQCSLLVPLMSLVFRNGVLDDINTYAKCVCGVARITGREESEEDYKVLLEDVNKTAE